MQIQLTAHCASAHSITEGGMVDRSPAKLNGVLNIHVPAQVPLTWISCARDVLETFPFKRPVKCDERSSSAVDITSVGYLAGSTEVPSHEHDATEARLNSKLAGVGS